MFGTPLWWTFPFNPSRVSKYSVTCVAGLVCVGHIRDHDGDAGDDSVLKIVSVCQLLL